MSVRSILEAGNGHLTTVGPEVRVETIAAILHQKQIGALPVVDDAGKVKGIISERDVVGIIATRGASALALKAEDIMTRRVVTATPEDSVGEIMKLMSARRIRHLPVCENDELKGIISMRDLIRHHVVELEMERNVMRDLAFARQ